MNRGRRFGKFDKVEAKPFMSKRIFVAVDISEEARQKIANYIADLRREFSDLRIGWDKPEKLHLTLKFLGEMSDSQLSKLEKIVDDISSDTGKFELKIQNTGVFPTPKKARVLWLDVINKDETLTELNTRLETECEKIGFPKETRKYVPHLTIARIKEPHKAKSLAIKHLQTKFEPVAFEVSAITIYESRLQATGSIYSVVSKHGLK